MPTRADITFQEALELIESLPEDQQESLIEVLHRRLVESRRERLALSIEEARQEYKRGEIQKGTVVDLMKEIAAEE